MEPRARTFGLAVLFESALGFLGVLVAWFSEIPLQSMLKVDQQALFRGLLACLPMLLAMLVACRSSWGPLRQLRREVESLVRELFRTSGWLELALVSLAAGLGEEILFRGALQPLVAGWTNPVTGIVVVGLLFGVAHAISTAYFVVATLIGWYFGWLAYAYADLIGPIVAHSLYDFVALSYFLRRVREREGRVKSEG